MNKPDRSMTLVRQVLYLACLLWMLEILVMSCLIAGVLNL